MVHLRDAQSHHLTCDEIVGMFLPFEAAAFLATVNQDNNFPTAKRAAKRDRVLRTLMKPIIHGLHLPGWGESMMFADSRQRPFRG
jgi:hypothetical protein